MPQFQSSAWWNAWQGDNTPRNRDAGGCNNNDHEISRHRKGRPGRRRHWCVSANGHCDGNPNSSNYQGGNCIGGDHIRYNSSNQGHNPCNGADAIKYLTAGMNGFSAKGNSDFQNSDIGLKCNFNTINDGVLRGWYNNHLKNHAGVKGHRGDGQGQHKFRSIWEQALFGIKTSSGTENAGYCLNTAHLMKDVGGGTCYDKIKDEISENNANLEARKWCETNRSSPKCKCVNVVEAGGSNFINHCKGKYNVVAGKPKAQFVWYGFDNKTEYLNIGQIEVYSDGENIVKNIDDSKVTVNSQYNGTQYLKKQMFDGNYISMYHSAGKPNDWIKIDLGKEYTIDAIKIFNRHTCGDGVCDDRWSGSYVKLLNSSGNEIARTERVVGDHMEGGKRVKTFDTFVTKDEGWAGCPEIVQAYKKFEDAGLTSASGLFGNSDCLVPGLCDGNVILPSSGRPNSCSNKLAICDQKVATDNIKAQNLLIEQGCEINFEANIDAPDGQTVTPPPSPPSSSSPSSTPLTSSSSTNDDDDDDDDEDKFYEKPGVQIGGVASSSMVSIFSCAMLIVLTL